eukprot:494450-Pleurochrysis_carterae.AAC.2
MYSTGDQACLMCVLCNTGETPWQLSERRGWETVSRERVGECCWSSMPSGTSNVSYVVIVIDV